MIRESIVVVLVGLGAIAGCSKSEESGAHAQSTVSTEPPSAKVTPVSVTPASAGAVESAASKEMFKSRCATCHGAEGKGNGPGAITLNPKPRNYTDKAWQSSVTDEQIKKTIVYGGAAVGKSPMMPASPDLDAKPEVVEGLVHIIRTFGN